MEVIFSPLPTGREGLKLKEKENRDGLSLCADSAGSYGEPLWIWDRSKDINAATRRMGKSGRGIQRIRSGELEDPKAAYPAWPHWDTINTGVWVDTADRANHMLVWKRGGLL